MTLDVEQQLRLRRESEVLLTRTPVNEAFMNWDAFAIVEKPALFVACITVLAILLVCGSLLYPAVRKQLTARLLRYPPLLSSTTVPTFSLLIAGWLLLVGLSTTFSLMKSAVYNDWAPERPFHESLTTPSMLLFIPKFWSAIGFWIYVVFAVSGGVEAGLFIALVGFFPTFYESLLIQGDEPDRVALWVTHFTFLVNIFIVASMAIPWVRQEYHRTVRDLSTHTQTALFRERPEFQKLRQFKKKQ